MNVLILVVIVAAPLHVQDILSGGAPPPAPTDVPAIPGIAPIQDHQVYAAADFARLAPKNALDMLRQVLSFAIRKNEELRGPGEATGNVLITAKRLSSKSDDIFRAVAHSGDERRAERDFDGATLDLPGGSGRSPMSSHQGRVLDE